MIKLNEKEKSIETKLYVYFEDYATLTGYLNEMSTSNLYEIENYDEKINSIIEQKEYIILEVFKLFRKIEKA